MPERRYFLDWLRVLAFAGLALFHMGLLYTTWDYNLKSPVLYPRAEWLLEALIPWRMALLFVISGVACRFLVAKLGPSRFAWNRLVRLLPVILTGMLLVNPLQVWVQLLANGATTTGYLEFWLTSYLSSDPAAIAVLGRPMPTWDHLWFLVYLLPYSLLLAAAAALLHRRVRIAPPLTFLFVAPGLWMAATNVLIETVAPVTHALVDDWGAHLKWLGLFAIGVLLALRDEAWAALRVRRWPLFWAAAGLLSITFVCRDALLHNGDHPFWTLAYRVAQGIYGWTAVLAITGAAARWLNQPSKPLSYLNGAVLPVYVLHQPSLLAAAYLLFPLRLSPILEVSLLSAAAALVPLGVYHLAIRRWTLLRWMFGVKAQVRSHPADAGRGTAAEELSEGDEPLRPSSPRVS